uniref:Uncharacterized protein n=1 Tax=Anguilla anguilla TaxID=7936 RepID=A0A0E9XAI1_ANGAN
MGSNLLDLFTFCPMILEIAEPQFPDPTMHTFFPGIVAKTSVCFDQT